MILGGKSRFPIINSPEMDKEKFLLYLEKQLRYEDATQVVRKGDLVLFTGTIFTIVRLRTFLRFGERGFVRVTTEGNELIVTYRLSFIWSFFVFLLGGLFLTVVTWNGEITDPATFTSIMMILFFVCIAIGFTAIAQLVSLAVFVERTHDAFMKK